MPKVVKQTPVKRTNNRRKTGGVLNRIAPIQEIEDHVKLAVYGKSGSGKTRFACSFPKPLLLIGTEDGTKSVRGDKGVDFVSITDSDDIPLLIDHLNQGKYKTAVLDTATMLQDLVLKEILGLEELPVQKSWGLASRDQYGQCGIKVKEYLRSLLALNCHVVIIAQERDFNTESNSELLDPYVGPGLTPSVAGWLAPAVDYVCQMFIRQQTVTKKVKIGGKEHDTEVKTGKAEFCLRTGPHETYMVKFRLPRGKELPPLIVDPTFTKVNRLLGE